MLPRCSIAAKEQSSKEQELSHCQVLLYGLQLPAQARAAKRGAHVEAFLMRSSALS